MILYLQIRMPDNKFYLSSQDRFLVQPYQHSVASWDIFSYSIQLSLSTHLSLSHTHNHTHALTHSLTYTHMVTQAHSHSHTLSLSSLFSDWHFSSLIRETPKWHHRHIWLDLTCSGFKNKKFENKEVSTEFFRPFFGQLVERCPNFYGRTLFGVMIQ